MENSITVPKIIHYCWFGGKPLSDSAQHCLDSWKKYCPDYNIIQWDETNFDVFCCAYSKEAYNAKKWAFVSDVARLSVLKKYGGVYMDTDVELIKPIDDLLAHPGVLGFETNTTLQTAFLICRKNCWLIEELLNDYDTRHFLRPDGSYDQTPNVDRMTQKCMEHGLQCNGKYQIIRDLVVFPWDYFSPKDHQTGVIALSPNSYLIHHFEASWYSQKQQAWLRFDRWLRRFCWPGIADSVVLRSVKKLYVHGFPGLYDAIVKKRRRR